MKRLSIIIAALLVLALSTGVALAKSGDVKGKGADKEKHSMGKAVTHQLKQEYEKVKKDFNDGKDKESKFSDVNGHWASATIFKMTAVGVVKGDAEGTFRPDDPVTFVETVALITRVTKTDEEIPDWAKVSVQNAVYNGEVPDWARVSVQSAVYNGVININRFHSQEQANRVQAAIIIAKALNLQPVDASDLPFSDGILVSQEDVGYIMALYQGGIMKGDHEGKFNPNSKITRAEMATIMERIVAGQGEEGETIQDD